MVNKPLPSLKLTAICHLKMDGWKMIVSFWDGATWQVRAVNFREGNKPLIRLNVPGSKLLVLGMVIPPLIGILIMGI